MSRALTVALSITSVLVGGIVGCGGAGEPCWVEGEVTFDSKPIAKGAIRFVTEDKTPGNGGIGQIIDGKYALTKSQMKAGKYLVVISGFEETGRTIKVNEGAPELKEERQYIPTKYNASSTLKLELDSGDNVADFNLTK